MCLFFLCVSPCVVGVVCKRRTRNTFFRRGRKATRNAVVEYCWLIPLGCHSFYFSSLPWVPWSDHCFAMRCAVVIVFAWMAFASGSTWQEPLLGAAKIPAAEIDRLGKEAELVAHKAVHCFFLVVCACDVACGVAGVSGKSVFTGPRESCRLPCVRRCSARRFRIFLQLV